MAITGYCYKGNNNNSYIATGDTPVAVGPPGAGGSDYNMMSNTSDGTYCYRIGTSAAYRTPLASPGTWETCFPVPNNNGGDFSQCCFDGLYLYLSCTSGVNDFLIFNTQTKQLTTLAAVGTTATSQLGIWDGLNTIYIFYCYGGATVYDRFDIPSQTYVKGNSWNQPNANGNAIIGAYAASGVVTLILSDGLVPNVLYSAMVAETAGPGYGLTFTWGGATASLIGTPKFFGQLYGSNVLWIVNSGSGMIAINLNPNGTIQSINNANAPNTPNIPPYGMWSPMYNYAQLGYITDQNNNYLQDGASINNRPTPAGFASAPTLLYVNLLQDTFHTIVEALASSGTVAAYIQTAPSITGPWNQSTDLGAGLAGFAIPFYIRIFPPPGTIIEGSFVFRLRGS
jgi:hypothetical protein